MSAVKTRKRSAPRGRKKAASDGADRLLAGVLLQNQANLVGMALSHAAAVLSQLVEAELPGSEGAAKDVSRAVAALEKAHGGLLAAELKALEHGE